MLILLCYKITASIFSLKLSELFDQAQKEPVRAVAGDLTHSDPVAISLLGCSCNIPMAFGLHNSPSVFVPDAFLFETVSLAF